MIESETIILGKSAAHYRGPISCNTYGSSHLTVEQLNPNVINGSSVVSCALAEDDTRSVRKAKALKANLAKRKQQQRARSVSAASAKLGQ